MSIIIDAVYENGVIRPRQPLELGEGTALRVVLMTVGTEEDPLAGVIGIGDSLLRPSELYAKTGGIGKGDPTYSAAERHDEIIYGPIRRRSE